MPQIPAKDERDRELKVREKERERGLRDRKLNRNRWDTNTNTCIHTWKRIDNKHVTLNISTYFCKKGERRTREREREIDTERNRERERKIEREREDFKLQHNNCVTYFVISVWMTW